METENRRGLRVNPWGNPVVITIELHVLMIIIINCSYSLWIDICRPTCIGYFMSFSLTGQLLYAYLTCGYQVVVGWKAVINYC